MTAVEPGTYIAWVGELGSGKTLGMSRFGAIQRLAGLNCWANYPTVFAGKIESIPHLFTLRQGCVLLDELQSILDSREFKNNSGMTQWALIVRKLGLRIFYTTQDFGQVDVRIRNITGWIYFCEPARWQGQKATKVQLVRHSSMGSRMVKKYIMPHTAALYGLYDSFDYEVKLTEEGRESAFDPNGTKAPTAAGRRPGRGA